MQVNPVKLIVAILFKFVSGIILLAPVMSYAGEQSRDKQNFDILDASISEIQLRLESGEITSVQLVKMYQARIAAYDQKGPALNTISVLNLKAAYFCLL